MTHAHRRIRLASLASLFVATHAALCHAAYIIELPALASPTIPAGTTFIGDLGIQATPVTISADGLNVVGYDYRRLFYKDGNAARDTTNSAAWLYRVGGPTKVNTYFVNTINLSDSFFAPGNSVSYNQMGITNQASLIVGTGAASLGNQPVQYRFPTRSVLATPSDTWWASTSAVNAVGDVIVGQVSLPGSSRRAAARWDDGQFSLLPGQSPQMADMTPVAVSADGAIVAGNFSTGSAFVARDGGLWPLNPAPYSSGIVRVNGLSGNGLVVVGYDDHNIATRWTGYRNPTYGDYIYNGMSLGFHGAATGASFDGSVIVGWDMDNSRAFIWDADHGARDLSAVLAEQNIALPSGWSISRACGVSADGRTIIGQATDAANQHAFLVRLDRSVTNTFVLGVPLSLTLPSSPLSVDLKAAGAGPVTLHQISPDELDPAARYLWEPNMGAGIYPQMWLLDAAGLGPTQLTFHYDEQAVLQAGIAESDLLMYHFTGGQWVAGGLVDPVQNTITLNVTEFSPFSLGVAVPEPASLSLVALAALLLYRRRPRRMGPAA